MHVWERAVLTMLVEAGVVFILSGMLGVLIWFLISWYSTPFPK